MVTAPQFTHDYDDVRERGIHRLLTADDLRALPDDGNRYEIIGGQLIVSPSPSTRHQQILLELASALRAHLLSHRIGQVFVAPLDVRLSVVDVVQPDLLVIMNDRTSIIAEQGISGPPDLVIEILSPSSLTTDFLHKSKLYEQHGVREYWIVNPESETVSVQTLEDDHFVIAAQLGREDTLTSAVLVGFEFPLSALCPEPIDESVEAPIAEAVE